MSKDTSHLSDDEINEFVDFFYHDAADGVYSADLERCLELTRSELSPRSRPEAHAQRQLMQTLLNTTEPVISREYLIERIQNWKVPSLVQAQKQKRRQDGAWLRRRGGAWRLARAYWAVHGYEIVFLCLVATAIAVSAAAEIHRYDATRYTSAFGYGVVVAKGCTGALYPTFFFMTLSMSRYFATIVRRWPGAARLLSVDLTKKFHVYMSSLGLVLATIHAVSHLTGTFTQGSDPSHGDAVTRVVAQKIPGHHYIDYIRSRAGFTGLAALGLLYTLAMLSVPTVRRLHYNLFQLGHLLMYPILGLLMAHGTAELLQVSIFGYILALPTCLLLFERISRVCLGFYLVDASIEILTRDTIEVTIPLPEYRIWDYTAGQYILILVPAISSFQWHPFTVSFCRDRVIKLLIKTDGDWTAKLRALGPSIQLAINGPFGAPAQRFGDFPVSLIIGAGVGVTPFSAILADLQRKEDVDHGSSPHHRRMESGSHCSYVDDDTVPPSPTKKHSRQGHRSHRRTDFHWIVRDRQNLSWLTGLLNRISASQQRRSDRQRASQLDIRINTHITTKHTSIVTYVLSWLLETYRSDAHPASLLTGLLNDTSFGRPDFDRILDEHYDDMRRTMASRRASAGTTGRRSQDSDKGHDRDRIVGVFYCGASEVGVLLADKCWRLTARGQEDGSRIEYHFIVEAY